MAGQDENLTNPIDDFEKIISFAKPHWVWDIAKALCLLGLVYAVICWVFQINVSQQIDGGTFIAVILALFSIGFSAAFYFRTNDSKTMQYLNSYAITKKLELLGRLEGTLNERLSALEKSLAALEKGRCVPAAGAEPRRLAGALEAADESIQSMESDLERFAGEKDKVIADLLSKAQLQESEKAKVEAELSEVTQKFHERSIELLKLRGEMHGVAKNVSPDTIIKYLRSLFPDGTGGIPRTAVRHLVNEAMPIMPPDVRAFLNSSGFVFEGRINSAGVDYVRTSVP